MTWNSQKRKLELPSNWKTLIRLVLRRDGFRCKINYQGCLKRASEVDHKIPGNNHELDNLQAACKKCHAKKSSQEGAKARKDKADRGRVPKEAHPGFAVKIEGGTEFVPNRRNGGTSRSIGR